MPDTKTQSDLLARVGVVLGSLIVLIISYVQTNVRTADRFTGAQGKVLEVRVARLEADVRALPPEWLKERIQKIEEKLDHIEKSLDRRK